MTFTHLKSLAPAMVASLGVEHLASVEATSEANIVNLIVQVIIGVLSVVGFFKNRKKQS